jgi:hypothetical protein
MVRDPALHIVVFILALLISIADVVLVESMEATHEH